MAIVPAWSRSPGAEPLVLPDADLESDEDAVGRGRRRRPQRLVLRAHRSVPVPGAGVHVRGRLHDRRAPRSRLGGARRPEPPLARPAREGGRPEPADRRATRAPSARAPRTTPGRRPGARFTAVEGQSQRSRLRSAWMSTRPTGDDPRQRGPLRALRRAARRRRSRVTRGSSPPTPTSSATSRSRGTRSGRRGTRFSPRSRRAGFREARASGE